MTQMFIIIPAMNMTAKDAMTKLVRNACAFDEET